MNLLCKDINGKPLEEFYQWDTGQKAVLSGIDISSSIYFHISNDPCGDAYPSKYEVNNNECIITIPNVLLTDHKPIRIYVFNKLDDYVSETLDMICIPVIPRPKPNDYELEDNNANTGSCCKYRTTLIDLSKVPSGKLYESVEGISGQYSWSISRDENNRPIKIIDDVDGHVCEVRWWD